MNSRRECENCLCSICPTTGAELILLAHVMSLGMSKCPKFGGTYNDRRREHFIIKKTFLTLDFDGYQLGRKNTLGLCNTFPQPP